MFINEPGKGRRVRCPICNAMFTIEGQEDYEIKTPSSSEYFAKLNCPDCGVPIVINLNIEPKQDVFVAGRC